MRSQFPRSKTEPRASPPWENDYVRPGSIVVSKF